MRFAILQAAVFRRMLALNAPPCPDWYMPERWAAAPNAEERLATWPWYYAELVMKAESK